MNQIGAIRRIDELGRIVIPKGIRNRLRIKEGDRLEITISATGKIEIQKYNAYQGNSEAIHNIALALAKELHYPVGIISQGVVFASSDDHLMPLEQAIDPALEDKLDERKTYTAHQKMTVDGEVHSFIVFPIAYDSEVLGGIIVVKEGVLNEEETRLVQAFRNLITGILKV